MIIPYRKQCNYEHRVNAESIYGSRPIALFMRYFRSTDKLAYKLYDQGFNVVPQSRGKKSPIPDQLHYTRLARTKLSLVFAGQPNIVVMLGATSRNLCVLECKTEASFQHHINQFRKRNFSVWAHSRLIWFFSADGLVDDILLADAEIYGQGQVYYPPFTDVDGVIYDWLIQEGPEPPTITLNQIDWLKDPDGQPVALNAKPVSEYATRIQTLVEHFGLTSASRLFKVSHNTLNFLEGNLKSSLAEDIESLLFIAACDMYGCGFELEESRKILVPIATDYGLRYSQANRTLHSAYETPRTRARLLEPWEYVLCYFEAHKPQASAEHKLLLALIRRASQDMDEQKTFRASQREISEIARVSKNTVRKWLPKLSGIWITPVGEDKISKATRWKFTSEIVEAGMEIYKNDPLILYRGEKLNGSILYKEDGLSTDAAEHGALGPVGMQLYILLCETQETLKVSQLIPLSGFKRRQVDYALHRLEDFGVAQKVERGRWVATERLSPEELDERVALKAGKLGRGKIREIEYQKERENYVTKLVFWGRAEAEPDFWRHESSHLQSRCTQYRDRQTMTWHDQG